MVDLANPIPGNEHLHRHAIELLAREAHLPVERVSDIYSIELKRLMAGARVKEYLSILTSRRVRVILRGETKSRG